MGPQPFLCVFLCAKLGGGSIPGQTETRPGLTMINACENELREADNDQISKVDVKKKKIRSLHIPKLKKFLKTFFFATGPPLGKTGIPRSLEGIHKGSKSADAQKICHGAYP